MAAKAVKPATITVYVDDTDAVAEEHRLANDKDWAVIFEDVLEVKATTGTHYYPFASIRKWTVTHDA